MEEIDKQHIQVPKMSLKAEHLEWIDPYVYACIKQYMNGETSEASPSILTIVEDSGFKKDAVIDSIKRLQTAGYFTKSKRFNDSTVYKFNEYKNFNIVSYKFMNLKGLSHRAKALFVAIQQYLLKCAEKGIAFTEYNTTKLMEYTGIKSRQTFRKYEKELENIGCLTYKQSKYVKMIPTSNPKQMVPEDGFKAIYRYYDYKAIENEYALQVLKLHREVEETKEELGTQKSQIENNTDAVNNITVALKKFAEKNSDFKEICKEINLFDKLQTLNPNK